MNQDTSFCFYERYTFLLDYAQTVWRTRQVGLRSGVYAFHLARWLIYLFVAGWFFIMGVNFTTRVTLINFDNMMAGFTQGLTDHNPSDPIPAWASFTAVVFNDLLGLGLGGAAFAFFRVLRASIEQVFLDSVKPVRTINLFKPKRIGDQPERLLVRAIRIYGGVKLSPKTTKLIRSIICSFFTYIEHVFGQSRLAIFRTGLDFIAILLFIFAGSAITSLLVLNGGWLYWVKNFGLFNNYKELLK